MRRTLLTPLACFFAFLAFLDSSYLALLHSLHRIPPCSLSGGCESVLTSSYATFFGISIALIGAVYYAFLMTLLLLFVQHNRRVLSLLLFFFTSCALIISCGLVYIQAGILHQFCQYCLGVEALNLLLWIVSGIQYLAPQSPR